MHDFAQCLLNCSAEAAAPVPAQHLHAPLWQRLQRVGWQPDASFSRGAAPVHHSDETLLRQLLQGSPEAFERLYERHLGKLLGYAQKQLPRTVAEDLAQEAFVVLWQKAESVLRPNRNGRPPNIEGFLFTVLRRRIADYQRQQWRETPVAESPETTMDHADVMMPRLLARDELAHLAKLAERSCTVLEQNVLALLSSQHRGTEIAHELGLSAVHARQLKHTALRKLRAALEAEQAGSTS